MDCKEKAIRQLGLFRECTPAEIRWIARNADEVDVPAGRTLGYEGSVTREFVVVMDGIASAADGDGEVLLGWGSYYGGVGLMSDERCEATVTTRTRTRVLVFGVAAFRGLVNRIPAVRSRMLRDLSERVREIDHESLSLRAVS